MILKKTRIFVTLGTNMATCPKCGCQNPVKNGHIHNGKQRFLCRTCGRQFVDKPENKVISQATKDLIDKLLLERISLAGIARVTGLSELWLQKKKGKLTLQCDEAWSFVGDKANQQWIWLALDVTTREIVGVYIGSRSEEGTRGLWDSLPAVYRQSAVCYTDFWSAYNNIFPQSRHKAVGKETGKTSYIERFNNTMRQRISRLVRKTLSFSKKLENHIGAIWYFIHHYNSSLPV